MDTKTRILVHEMPELLQGLFEQAILDRPDMELVRATPGGLPSNAPQPPDVVVTAVDAVDDGLASDLLWRWPRSEVLAVTIDGDHAAVYQLHPRRRLLGQGTPLELLDAIPTTARRRREHARSGVRSPKPVPFEEGPDE
jgi:hypothetical protein